MLDLCNSSISHQNQIKPHSRSLFTYLHYREMFLKAKTSLKTCLNKHDHHLQNPFISFHPAVIQGASQQHQQESMATPNLRARSHWLCMSFVNCLLVHRAIQGPWGKITSSHVIRHKQRNIRNANPLPKEKPLLCQCKHCNYSHCWLLTSQNQPLKKKKAASVTNQAPSTPCDESPDKAEKIPVLAIARGSAPGGRDQAENFVASTQASEIF